MYQDETGTCHYCIDNCAICADGQSCQYCDWGYEVSIDETTGLSYCVEQTIVECDWGFYFDETQQACLACIESCDVCYD